MKKQMTVRLEKDILSKLSNITSEKGITRQDFVESLIIEATGNIPATDTDKTFSCVSQEILDLVKSNTEQLSDGTEISLKSLVGDEWEKLTDATRRVFGKQFRDMVMDGDFPRLKVGRKKSNNEQQYIVL